jgi:hypothetical protein
VDAVHRALAVAVGGVLAVFRGEVCAMNNDDAVMVLSAVYVALLRHPHDKWRAENQSVYAEIVDALARATGQPPYNVQTMFERVSR